MAGCWSSQSYRLHRIIRETQTLTDANRCFDSGMFCVCLVELALPDMDYVAVLFVALFDAELNV